MWWKQELTITRIIILVGIMTVLFAVVMVITKPFKQFTLSKNRARTNDVNILLNAIHQYATDNNGNLPPQITTKTQNISSIGADLCPMLITGGKYLSAIPQDPNFNNGAPIVACTTYDTHYMVIRNTDGLVTVSAPSEEDGVVISVSR